MKLMRQAGVNVVSVAIFSWGLLQDADEVYTFEWLDRLMDLLAANGIMACLATATASPPPWLSRKYPDVLAVDAQGRTFSPGSRQHYSPSSPSYRRYAAALVRELAKRYIHHPALLAWHVNNEFGCHLSECHSEASTAAFRAWLRVRYESLEALNAAWGTAFWSQHYYSWDEILTPRHAPYHTNPTQQLDFKRFMSEAFRELYIAERDILRAANPEIPITTNFMGAFKPLDYWRWAPDLDFAAWDSYPDPDTGHQAEATAALGHDLTRSLQPKRPWVLMEQVTSQVNWRPVNVLKRSGAMRLWSWQAVARGADGAMFFQWRAAQGGSEKYHGAMVPHVGVDESRIFREVCTLGAEMEKAAGVAGSTMRAAVAIIFDWNNWWAVELDSRPARIDYAATVAKFHRYFFERNIAVDFVAPGAPLAAYRLVAAPAIYLLTKADAENLEQYVAGGGVLLATYFSGIVDENDRVVLGGYPGYLRRTLGLWVEEWSPAGTQEKVVNIVRWQGGKQSVPCGHWCDVVHLEGAEALATFTRDFFAGHAAWTSHAFGRGTAFYIATEFESRELAHILDHACRSAEIQTLLKAPRHVEVTERFAAGARYIFILNHGEASARVPLGNRVGLDVLSGRRCGGSLTVPPRGVVILQVEETGEPGRTPSRVAAATPASERAARSRPRSSRREGRSRTT